MLPVLLTMKQKLGPAEACSFRLSRSTGTTVAGIYSVVNESLRLKPDCGEL